MSETLLDGLSTLFSQLFLASIVGLLLDFRSPEKVWRRRWIIVVASVEAANIIWVALTGFWPYYSRLFFLTLTLPVLVVSWFCSRRVFSAVFALLTALFCASVGLAAAMTSSWLAPDLPGANILGRTVFLTALLLLVLRMRPAYRRVLSALQRSAWVLCLVPVSTTLISWFMLILVYPTQPLVCIIVLWSICIVGATAYLLIYLFFEQVYGSYAAESKRDLLSAQLSAVQGRVESIREAQESIAIQRHDLRHIFAALDSLLEQGDLDEAKAYLRQEADKVDERKLKTWCSDPILDAVLSSYFGQAERQGIRIKADITLPDALPVDSAELSTVFANALENAIRACMELPPEGREITCTIISHPQFMFRVGNPCRGRAKLDENGLPLASEPGHGIGTRSIAAFCERHGATCVYHAQEGYFTLMIAL